MSFNPEKYRKNEKFGEDLFIIRPAVNSDRERELVWEGYKNAPDEFYKHLNPITHDIVEMWYPLDNKPFTYEQTLPFNVMKVIDDEEVEYIANSTLMFQLYGRFKHTAHFSIGVLPKYQKLGIGNYLTKLAILAANDKPGIARIELTVNSENTGAINLYKISGFKEEGKMRNKWLNVDGTTDDMLVMGIIFPAKLEQLKK